MKKRILKKSKSKKSVVPSLPSLDELQNQIRELTETLDAISNGQIDGIIVNQSGKAGDEQIYTLQTAEHPYRVLVEEMNEGAVTLVDDEVITYSNSAFARIIRTPLEKVIGQSFQKFVDKDSLAQMESILRIARKSGAARGEMTFTSDTGLISAYLSASLIDQHGVNALCMVVTDLTEQKRNEKIIREEEERSRHIRQLESERAIADTANQAKSNFLANMSHEIRTPLGAILGFAQLMGDPNQTFSDRQDCVATILRNGDQLARVINEVLDLSKIESDKMEIEKIEFSLAELVEDVTSLMNLQAQEKGLDFSVQYVNEVSEFLVSDPTRLRQILFNMLGNAVKFTTRGSVKLSISATDLPKNKIGLNLEVRDTGPGLNSEQRARIFQPFMQADNTMTRKHGGTGLGLVLSRKLARALGGDLILSRTEEGVGSSFVATIVAQAPISSATGKNSYDRVRAFEEEASITALRGTCVLVVDDAPDNRVLVSRFLKAAGADVECAIDGEDGISKAVNGNFDLVLMDIQMPGVDGFEALKKLRSMNFQKPIVALTAHAMKGDRERCLNAGFSDHLVKPINRAALIRTVNGFRA